MGCGSSSPLGATTSESGGPAQNGNAIAARKERSANLAEVSASHVGLDEPGGSASKGDLNSYDDSEETELLQLVVNHSLQQTLRPRGSRPTKLMVEVGDLHDYMPKHLKSAPMRLLHIDSVLRWKRLAVYEDVSPADCISIPYSSTTDETWQSTALLSWRWSLEKPATLTPGTAPMTSHQLRFLKMALLNIKKRAPEIKYVWIDWCCVPQYSSSPMLEVARSKIFYARAIIMIVLPDFTPIDSQLEIILGMVLSALTKDAKYSGNKQASMAAKVLAAILEDGYHARLQYFGRVWTLAERLARCSWMEELHHWLPLQLWMGMVVDALMTSSENRMETSIYWSKLFPANVRQNMDSILDNLSLSLQLGNYRHTGLVGEVASLFVESVNVWCKTSMHEVPNKEWLGKYMLTEAISIYKAWSWRDAVWSVLSYFSWKDYNQSSLDDLMDAVSNLCQLAGVEPSATTIWGHIEAERKKALAPKKARAVSAAPPAAAAAPASQPAPALRSINTSGADKAAARMLAADRLAADRLAADKAEADRLAADKVLTDRLTGKKLAADRLAADRLDRERAATDRLVADRLAREKAETDRLAADRLEEEKAAADRRTAEKALTDRLAADEAAADRLAEEEASADRRAMEKAAAAQLAAERKEASSPEVLLAACRNGDLGEVMYVLRSGANVNKGDESGASPLYFAASRGSVPIMTALIEAGANINHTVALDGETVLHTAVHHGHLPAVLLLLSTGVNMEVKDKNVWTPLCRAARDGNIAIVKALIAKGANMEAKNKMGETPLLVAATWGSLDVVKALLSKGANVNAKNKVGKTAFDMARSKEVKAAIRTAM